MRRVDPTEHEIQAAVFQWWASYCRTKGLDERLLFAVPNGAHLAGDARVRAIKMHKLKAAGLRPGVPDVFLDVARHGQHGLRLELKRRGKKPEPHQWELMALLEAQGYRVETADSVDKAIAVIMEYLQA